MVSNGGGSALIMAGASRALSCAVATPNSTLQGSFLRDLPAIHVRSSSLRAMPSARRVEGPHSGSRRVLSACFNERSVGIDDSTLPSSALISGSRSASSLPSSPPVSLCDVFTLRQIPVEMVERVTPERAVGRGASASLSTIAAMREATSSPRLLRSASRAAP